MLFYSQVVPFGSHSALNTTTMKMTTWFIAIRACFKASLYKFIWTGSYRYRDIQRNDTVAVSDLTLLKLVFTLNPGYIWATPGPVLYWRNRLFSTDHGPLAVSTGWHTGPDPRGKSRPKGAHVNGPIVLHHSHFIWMSDLQILVRSFISCVNSFELTVNRLQSSIVPFVAEL